MKKQKQKGSVFFAMLTQDEQTKFASEAINQGKDMTKLLSDDYFNFLHFTGNGFKFDETADGAEYWVELSASGRDGLDAEQSFLDVLEDNSIGSAIKDSVADTISEVIFDVVKKLVLQRSENGITGRELYNKLTNTEKAKFREEFYRQRGKSEFAPFMKLKFSDTKDMLMSSFGFRESLDKYKYWESLVFKYSGAEDLEQVLKDLNIDVK